MEKQLQLHVFVTDLIAKHNDELVPGTFISYDKENLNVEDKKCPPDTQDGYYILSGGNCVFIPYG